MPTQPLTCQCGHHMSKHGHPHDNPGCAECPCAAYRPAHDAPQVERIQEIRTRAENAREGPWALFRAESISIETMDGGYVVVDQVFAEEDEDAQEREHDALFLIHAREDIPYLLDRVATLEAEKQQLEAENRELREARDAFRDEASAVRRNLLAEVRDISQRADAAESSLATLREAVRELVDEGVPMDMGCCFHCASSHPERRHHSGCNWAKLRALVTPQGE